MGARARLVRPLLAALAVGCVAAPAASGAARAGSPAALPTIYVNYTMQCTFSLVNDFGQPVTTIAPGTYQVEVVTPIMFKLVRPAGTTGDTIAANDYTGCKGWVQFQLTGPGLNDATTLDYGCEAFYTFSPVVFQPSSQYVFQDLNQPSLTRTVVNVAATGTPWTPVSPYSATTHGGQTQADIVGSLVKAAPRGTLYGTLSPKGVATLTWKGKPVSSLKQGRYRVSILDEDGTGTFTLKPEGGSPDALTPPSFTGRHSVTVTLTKGRWSYYARAGTAHRFVVTA